MGTVDISLSEKIKGLSVLCSVLVCFNHAYVVPTAIEHASWSGTAIAIIENSFRYGVARISTPFFFMVSAYLLFREASSLRTRYGAEIRKRVRSLLVPFLFWSTWSFVIIASIQQIPFVMGQSGRPPLMHLPIPSIARMLFWEPAAYPLWFVRDLFLLICVSPILASLFRSRSRAWASLTVFTIAWIAYPEVKESRALLFFSLGAILAMHPIRMPITTAQGRLSMVSLWLGASLINATLMVRCGHEICPLTCLAIATGLLTIWSAWSLIRRGLFMTLLLGLAPYTFFVYAAHEPVEDLIRAGLLQAFGTTPSAALAAFLITAVLSFGGCMGVAVLLSRHAQGFFALAAGGRGPSKRIRAGLVTAIQTEPSTLPMKIPLRAADGCLASHDIPTALPTFGGPSL